MYTGQRFTGPEHALEANTPEGCRAVEGEIAAERVEDDELRRSRILFRLEALERKQQRRVRELLAASDPQLKALDDEAAALRVQL